MGDMGVLLVLYWQLVYSIVFTVDVGVWDLSISDQRLSRISCTRQAMILRFQLQAAHSLAVPVIAS